MNALLEAPLTRIFLLAFLVLGLQIPAAMIAELGRARAEARDDAQKEIAAHWGGRQEIVGPFLVVPCRLPIGEGWQSAAAPHQLVLAPEQLRIEASAQAQERRRGLFKVPVYRAELKISGRFRVPPAHVPLPPGATPQWGDAQLALRLADVHALDVAGPLLWRGKELTLEPGSGHFGGSGVHAPATPLSADHPADFALTLTLRGSGALSFAPSGLDTVASLRSAWPDPAFQGAWLPETREVGANGFTAQWRIPYVARGLPAAWPLGAVSDDQLKASLFGAGFLAPVDPYRMAERSLKYCPLFIGLTFVLVWLLEVVGGVRVHPVQYLMLGAALCLFYLLELSLAEQFGFGAAYLLASGAVTLQVTLYSRAALGGRGTFAILAAVASLYSLLYLLLSEDDYALMAGSLCLFAVLSAVMFLTRRITWSAPVQAPAPKPASGTASP